MKVSSLHLGFVGFGHLAQVICRAIDAARLIPRSQISFIQRDPDKMRKNEKEFGVTSTSLDTLIKKSDLILICVRPNQLEQVLPHLVEKGIHSKMVISTLTGIKMGLYQKHFGMDAQILRAMPNIASSVGEGMTVFSYGNRPSHDFKSLANSIFSCMGKVIEVPDSLMDISTAVAGSGPGFVFSLIEAFARAGEKGGLPYEKALHMASQAFLGAAKMIQKGGLPEQVIQQVTTPNGTTEAGLKVLRKTEIDKHLQAVIEASADRARQISEELQL